MMDLSRADFKYEEIIALLERCHGAEVSLRTLPRLPRKQIFTEKGTESCTRYSFSMNYREVVLSLDTVQCSKDVSKIE